MSKFRTIQDLLNRTDNFDNLAFSALFEEHGDNFFFIRKFGRTLSLGVDDDQDVWTSTGMKSFLTSAETLDIVSTDVNDTAAGTGARVVLIRGLDNDYNMFTEAVVLNGTTPVTTTNTYLRVFSTTVVSTGSTNENQGTITATATTAGTIQDHMPPLEGVSSGSHFTVPAGYTALTYRFGYSCYRFPGGTGGEKRGTAKFIVRFQNGTEIKTSVLGVSSQGTGLWDTNLSVPIAIPEKTDTYNRFISETSNTGVSLFFDIVFVKNTEFLNNFTQW